MPSLSGTETEDDRRLRERVALSLAIEESFVSALCEAADRFRRDGDEAEARRLTDLVRTHRVEMCERRAVLAAAGLVI